MKTKERGRERSVRTRRTRFKEEKKRKKSQKGSDFAERKREGEREQQESESDEPMVPGNAESARPRGWSDGEEFRDMCRMRYTTRRE